MKLDYPIENFVWSKNVSQLFGVNKSLYNSNFGIPGHNGVDIFVQDEKLGYGTPILATHKGTIQTIQRDVPHRTSGNGIKLLSEDNSFSTTYWHLADFNCNIGDKVETGQVIGYMGNSGFVRPLPTQEQSHLGTHLHFGAEIYGQSSEYGTYVDPVPFLFKEGDKLPIYWNRDLFITREGDDVSWLQTCLKLEGFAEDYQPISYFGAKTMRDVRKLQQKYQISPSIGYFGEQTKRALKKYSSFYIIG